MFNVCPGCGEYRPAREVRPDERVAICECGHVQTYRAGPLFLVGGAAGTGKSTILRRFVTCDLPVVALDGDILWREEFRPRLDDWTENWLRMAKNISLAAKPVMLFAAGLIVPGNVERCVERRYFSRIHRLALTCDDDVLAQRLRTRPAWRRASDADALDEHVRFNRWLRRNADAEGIALVDTTTISVAEACDVILAWLGERISA